MNIDFEKTRLDKVIRRRYGKNIKQSVIEKAIRNKDILVNGKKVPSSFQVIEGQDDIYIHKSFEKHINISKNENFSPNEGAKFKKLIVYEDNNLIIINKPSGLATQLGTSLDTAVDVLAKNYNPEARLVHRLDKNTSGITVLSKNLKTSRYMLHLFKNKQIKKTYIAIISSANLKKENGIINIPIEEKEAITLYKVIKNLENNLAIIEVNPKTGRSHQIRIHMQHIGCPILGDQKYGGRKYKKLCLHAYRIQFKDINGQTIDIKTQPPQHISKYLDQP